MCSELIRNEFSLNLGKDPDERTLRMKTGKLTGFGFPSARHLSLAPLELEKATESGRSARRRRTPAEDEAEAAEDGDGGEAEAEASAVGCMEKKKRKGQIYGRLS